MTAAAPPRLVPGVVGSLLLHGGVVAAFLLSRSGPRPASPPIYSVKLIAAPAGPRAIGVVQSTPPAVVPAPSTPVPLPKPTPPVARATKTAAKPKPAPAAATPVPQPKSAPPAAAKPAPAAGGGPTGGRGADVATIDTPGIDFDYPGYSTNIVRQLITRFGEMPSRLRAEVRFVIRRDGSVDAESIRLVTPSGNYAFDQRALGAVETAAASRAFGPLPPGFREDILPVTFWFSPAGIR